MIALPATGSRVSTELSTAELVDVGRHHRARRGIVVVAILAVLVLILFAASLMYGHIVYSPAEVWAALTGSDGGRADFTVGRLRFPRAVMAVLAGLCFGMAGVTFQTMLRNPLASPDIIGISSGASAAAVTAIVMLNLTGAQISFLAIVAGLIVALVIYALAFEGGVLGTRLILIGIGIAAMLDSVTSYVLSQATEWDLQDAMRWLTGSLNSASWDRVLPVALAVLILCPVLLTNARNLQLLQLGDDSAAALGSRVNVNRLLLIVAAVGLIAFATSSTGPIAFVAFLSGPIAARLVRHNASLLIPSALVGAVLVLAADLFGQYLFGTRYPVGVVTGILGAPYLLYLIIRSNRTGGSL